MRKAIIDLRQFLGISEGESHYKGYFIPGNPGWLRVMVSKQRADGLIEAQNIRVFLDGEGHVLWHKPGLRKLQEPGDFERDLMDFRRIIEEAGMLIFIQDYRNGKERRTPSEGP